MNSRTKSLLTLLAIALAIPAASEAAVVCQKKNRIKIRPTECKKNEVQISAIAGGVAGIWEHTSGGAGLSLLEDSTGSEPQFVTLDLDGTGRLNLFDPDTGALRCGGFSYSQGSGLTVDLAPFGQSSQVWLAAVDGDTMTLTDASGTSSTFARASAVDEAFECKSFAENQRFEGLPEPDNFGGLAFDGTSLWYEEDNTAEIFPVSPTTGAVGTPVTIGFSQFTHVHAMQGADFWAHCGCGGSQEAQRRTMAGVEVDEVDTDNDLGVEIGVRAIAYDPGASKLYLHGFRRDGQGGRLLEVNSDAEPDVLLAEKVLDVSLRSMTFDGTHLWAVSGFGETAVVLQIEPVNAAILATYENPDKDLTLQGIASVGTDLFLLAERDSEGVIVGVTP